MEKRIRALKAIILVIIMVMELFGTDALRAVAEEIVEIDTEETQDYHISHNKIHVTENGKVTGEIFGSGGTIINDGEINSVTSDGTAITNNKKINSVTAPSPAEIVNDNNGTIGELSVSNSFTDRSTTINMKSGTITTVKEEGNGNTTYILEGGTIGTFTANGSQASKVAIKGAMVIGSFNGNIALSGEGKGILTITQNLSISDSYSGELITVNKDTNITVPEGKTVQVTCDETDFTLSGITGKTLTEAKGNTVTAELATAAANTMTVKTPFPAEKQLRSKTPVTATYQAKKGYYFPLNYSVSVSDTAAATAGVVRSEDAATITVEVKIKSDSKNIVVTLPAATEKGTQAAPTGLSGGVGTISGVTNAMEYSKDPNAKEWNAIGGISDSGTGEINDLDAGDWYVRYKETDTKQASPEVKVIVKAKQKESEKLAGSGKVVVGDVYYGKTPYVRISSETNDVRKAVIVYKEKSKPDTAYTSLVPSQTGTYIVKATLPGNDTYKEVVVATEFKISYAPAPALAYTLEGTRGENGYYTSDVIIRPAQGYMIARALNGTYGQKLKLEKTQSASQIYLKNAAGEMTDAISIDAIKIKQEVPTVNLEHGKTYYGDSKKLVIRDDYLNQVYVNGISQNLNGTELILQLGSNNGKKKYEITAVDVAGNKKTILVTVAAAWMKTGIIPEGVPVNLETGNGYQLGTGNWKVQGDNTSYSGGTDFYVKKDGSYTFGKQ